MIQSELSSALVLESMTQWFSKKINARFNFHKKGKQLTFYIPHLLDQWVHIAATYSMQSGQAKIFINGNMNKQGPGSGRLSEDWDSYAAFGKHTGSVTDTDTLDEVYMYSRELSSFEIKALYDNCNFGFAKTREL